MPDSKTDIARPVKMALAVGALLYWCFWIAGLDMFDRSQSKGFNGFAWFIIFCASFGVGWFCYMEFNRKW